MGKNFSYGNKPRRKGDFYQTPYALTRRLLEIEKLHGRILEPACGKGAIVKILKEFGYTDIASYDISQGRDFLDEHEHYDTIITNPPFSLAREFILHAMQICNEFYFLLPLNYLHGKARLDEIFSKKQLQRAYVFTRYPMLDENVREDGKHKTGMMVYAWYHFNTRYHGDPSIQWLDNNADCV